MSRGPQVKLTRNDPAASEYGCFPTIVGKKHDLKRVVQHVQIHSIHKTEDEKSMTYFRWVSKDTLLSHDATEEEL